MGKHRTRLQILKNILSVINDRKDVRKTQIMYKAYLSYSLLTRYLNDVMKAGLVVCNDDNCYLLTQKGVKFLSVFSQYSKSQKVINKKLDYVEEQRSTLEDMCPTSEVDKNR
jgi:predicted transcriptional regulator